MSITESQLQQLLAQAQPKQNPEDQYLAQLAQNSNNGVIEYQPPIEEKRQLVQRPSEASVGDLQGRYQQLYAGANNPNMTGLGALFHGIAAAVLAPKVRKAQAGAEKNRIKMQDLETEAKQLAVEKDNADLNLKKQEVLNLRRNEALSRITLGDYSNPEDLQLAQVETHENGKAKTFKEKYGEFADVNNIGKLSFFSRDLESIANQPYSLLTANRFNSALQKASEQERLWQKTLVEARSKKGESDEAQIKALASLTNAYTNAANVMVTSEDPEVIAGAKQVLYDTGKVLRHYTIKNGLSQKGELFDPAHVEKSIEDQNAEMFLNIMSSVSNAGQKFGVMANTPKTSPSKTKSSNPIPVGTNEAPVKPTPPKVDVFDVQ